jgi:hypothetical protein
MESESSQHLDNKHILILLIIFLFLTLSIGTLGFHHICKLSHIDSFYNSCLVVTTLGPNYNPKTTTEKLWISFYGLVSVILFLSVIIFFIYKLVKINLYEMMNF